MSIRITICYGHPYDPEAFDEHYVVKHLPLAKSVPGVSEITWGKCIPLDGGQTPHYAVANMQFPDLLSLQRAMQSGEMRQASKDLRLFATGGVSMYAHEEETVLDDTDAVDWVES